MKLELSLHRVIDANLNRSREGLRVLEEVARMVVEDANLTRKIQRLRYDLDRVGRSLNGHALLNGRNAKEDVGRPVLRGNSKTHRNVRDLIAANVRRVQEALRVLEEFSRLSNMKVSQQFGNLRFKSYSLEQELIQRLTPVRHR